MLWNSLTEWWADLWGEDITDDASKVNNLYSTQFGKDLFYKIREIISERIMVTQMRRATGDDGFIYAVPSENNGIYGLSTSPLQLPYPPPEIIDDDTSWAPLGRFDDLEARPKDGESSYALRTSPPVLRSPLVQTIRSAEEGEAKWDKLYDQLDDYLKASYQTNGPDQWISNGPTSDARCLMSIENIESGGVQVVRAVKNRQGSIERKTIAQYIPEPGDAEPDQQSVDYYNLLSSIGRPSSGGPILTQPRNRIVMPSRNDTFISDILDNAMFGYLYRFPIDGAGINSKNTETESISVSNYTRFIDEQIDFSFANDQGKSRMKMYLRGTNKPLYKPNDEECVTNKEVSIANAIALSIQARLQRFFMNVVSMASSYPHWNSLGTNKLVVDYLSRQIYDDLETKGLSNVIFEYADVFKKVYVDNPENGISSFDQNTPREYIKSLIEQIYSTMLVNVSEDVYRQLDTSPYSPSVTRSRYTGLVKTLYEKMLAGLSITIAEQSYNIYGITGEASILQLQSFITDSLLDESGEPTSEGFYYGAYYFPIGFMIAEYLIAYDSLINITRNFKQGHYRSLIEIANADDAILSSIVEQEVTRYSSQHVGFPYDIVTSSTVTDQRVLKTYYSVTEVQSRFETLAVILGIDSDYFTQHLRFFLATRNEKLLAEKNILLDNAQSFKIVLEMEGQDMLLPGQDIQLALFRDSVPNRVDKIYSQQVVIDFISKVLDGSLPSIEQSFPSILSWTSLNEDSEPLLQNSYEQFFENKIVDPDTLLSFPGFDVEELYSRSLQPVPPQYKIGRHANIEQVISKFISEVNKSYEDDNYSDFTVEYNELKTLVGAYK
jgi:hypothetical protein